MRKLILFSGLLLIAACDKKPEIVYQDVEAIRASDIYRFDSVADYIDKYADQHKEMAAGYLKQAETVKANDPLKALYYVKRAVTLHPTLENYKRLAAELSANESYNELVSLYYFLMSQQARRQADGNYGNANYIFGAAPDREMFYEHLVAKLMDQHTLYSDEPYYAKELGFDLSSFKEQLFSDKRVKIDMTTPAAKDMMLLFMTKEEVEAYSKLGGTFREYLASAPDVSPVFDITLENCAKFNYDDFNGTNSGFEEDYEGVNYKAKPVYVYRQYLQESKADPNSWTNYNLKHYMDINDKVKAVIYAVDSSETACPINMRHIYHRLVTYDTAANIIDSKIVAYQLGTRGAIASFNNNKFSITEIKRNWKKPYVKQEWGNDFDNDLTGTEPGKTSNFEIKPDGKIQELLN